MTLQTTASEPQRVALARLVKRGSVVVLAVLITCALLLQIPAPANDFLQSIQDKLHDLSAARDPRMVLIGGSSTAFGFNSATIAQATGRNVINMGVHAGTGIEFMLRTVQDSIRKGDIVIVSPEYELFDPSLRTNTVLYQILPFVDHPDAYLHSIGDRVEFRLQGPVQRLQRIFSYALKKPLGRFAEEKVYRRDLFNSFGDIALPDSTQSVLDTVRFGGNTGHARRPMRPLDRNAVQLIRTFADGALQRGATVYLLYPPMVAGAFQDDQAFITATRQELESVLPPAVTILGEPTDFVYAPNNFFDTQYHLTPHGRDVRTAHFLGLLRDRERAR